MTAESLSVIRAVMLAGGIGRHAGGMYWSVRRLGQSLAAAGMDVRVVSYDGPESREVLDEWLPLQPVLVRKRWLTAFGYAPEMLDRVTEQASDLVHVHGLWMYPSCVATAWSKRAERPHIVSPRGMLDGWALANSPFKKRLAGWLYEHRHLHSAACLHALAPGEVSAIRNYGMTNPVCLIPNGVDLPVASVAIPAPWEAILGNSRRVILFIGRLHPKKGLHELVEGWRRLLTDTPSIRNDWALVIAGWDDRDSKCLLAEQIGQSNCRDSILLIDALYGDVKQAALEKAEAFALPSHSEGMPLSILEAWANCLPVLMTPFCNLEEGFVVGAALKIEPHEVSIANGIRTLIEMGEERRRQMGQAGRRLVEVRFTWSVIAEQMETVYKWLAHGGSEPSCVSYP